MIKLTANPRRLLALCYYREKCGLEPCPASQLKYGKILLTSGLVDTVWHTDVKGKKILVYKITPHGKTFIEETGIDAKDLL